MFGFPKYTGGFTWVTPSLNRYARNSASWSGGDPLFLVPPYRIRDINAEHEGRLNVGQRAADTVANGMGSWRFILTQSGILAVWVAVNALGFVAHWDPYPFIFLNLVMSLQAAYAAPIIMMTQNRQGQKDRLAAEQNYQVNIRVETAIMSILQHFDYQDDLILQPLRRIEQHGESAKSEDHRAAPAVAGDSR